MSLLKYISERELVESYIITKLLGRGVDTTECMFIEFTKLRTVEAGKSPILHYLYLVKSDQYFVGDSGLAIIGKTNEDGDIIPEIVVYDTMWLDGLNHISLVEVVGQDTKEPIADGPTDCSI